jgi:hypothetical protein
MRPNYTTFLDGVKTLGSSLPKFKAFDTVRSQNFGKRPKNLSREI